MTEVKCGCCGQIVTVTEYGNCDCGALLGSTSEDRAFLLVKNEWETCEVKDIRYYDIDILGEDGKIASRRHGWYNPANGKIVQAG